MKINFKIKKRIVDGLIYLQKKNWVITIIIFLIVFISAMFVWRDCILNPQPSEATLNNILKIEQEYKTKMQVIEKNHQELEEQNSRFNDPKKELGNREYFESLEQSETSSSNYTSDSKSFNPQIVH